MIQHVVLFRVRSDADPSQITAFINGLNSLISLDQVVHLTAGTLLPTQSSSLTFTHVLYSRYNSIDDLNAYTVHPAHVSLVSQTANIIDDVMAVDWFSDFAVDTAPGSALKFMFVKMKEKFGETSERVKVLEVIRDEVVGSIVKMSFGENIFPNRAKGYSIGAVMVFDDINLNLEGMILQNVKISDLIEEVLVLVLDYNI